MNWRRRLSASLALVSIFCVSHASAWSQEDTECIDFCVAVAAEICDLRREVCGMFTEDWQRRLCGAVGEHICEATVRRAACADVCTWARSMK